MKRWCKHCRRRRPHTALRGTTLCDHCYDGWSCRPHHEPARTFAEGFGSRPTVAAYTDWAATTTLCGGRPPRKSDEDMGVTLCAIFGVLVVGPCEHV